MARTVRQRFGDLKTFTEADMTAVLGKWSTNSGDNPDLSYKVVFGESPVLSADTETEIWTNTAGGMEVPTNAETLAIVSSSIQDDNGGTGVDAVFVEGLDNDYLPQSELVILNGTGTVNSVNTYRHVSEVNCLNITTSGTTNAGNISITNSTSGDRLGYISTGQSISEHGQYLVPAGYNALLLDFHSSTFKSGGTKADRKAEMDLIFMPLDGGAGNGIRYKTIKIGVADSGVTGEEFALPLVIGARTCIVPTATADTANTIVTIQYDLLLIKETIDIDSIF
jgi:hypothetical protein